MLDQRGKKQWGEKSDILWWVWQFLVSKTSGWVQFQLQAQNMQFSNSDMDTESEFWNFET